MLLFAVVSCDSSKEPSANGEMEEEAVSVPFTIFSLDGIDCFWVMLPTYPIPQEELIIINNDRELKKYIVYWGDISYPVIDFSKYTLLLIRGVARANVVDICVNLFQNGRRYTLNVDIQLGPLAVMEGWAIGILTPKPSNNANITLKVEEVDL
jgi:hypothetical protein